jgi:DNA polymerase-1
MLARTGRMSYSGDAPVHQFPGPARGILLADNREEARRTMAHPLYLEDGKTAHPCTCSEPKGLVSIDWSQIEPVVAANIAGDVEVLAGYEDGTSDLYSAVSEAADRPRKAAKTALLAQLYGQGRKSLAVRMQMSVNEVDDVIDAVWGPLPKTKEMFNTHWSSPGLVARIANEYETVFTVSGRIIPIPGNWWPCFFNHDSQSEINACRKCNERGMVFKVPVHIAVNSMVQGSAYDILAESVVALHEAGLSDAVYLLMHDEIVCDAEAAPDIRKIMETPPERLVMMAGRTPVLRTDMAHLGERWAAA